MNKGYGERCKHCQYRELIDIWEDGEEWDCFHECEYEDEINQEIERRNEMNTNTKSNKANTNTKTSRKGRKENTMKKNNKKFDIYATIAERIMAELEQGTIPWHKPWFGAQTGAYSRLTGKPYSLLNQMLLGDDGEYATMKQINKEGGRVNKGAHSTMITYWNIKTKTVTNDEGEEEVKTYCFLKPYWVFNIKDTTLEPKKRKEVEHEPCELAERIINGYVKTSGIIFHNSKPSDRAFYRASTDCVTVPMMSQFNELEEYYSTAFHELTHSTGHESRLKRGVGDEFFGSVNYGKEELVAELGASCLVNICGLETEKSFKNNAAYIENWMNAIKEEPKMIVSAAGKADKAVTMILGDTLEEVEAEEPKAKPKTKKAKAKKDAPQKGVFKKASYYIKTKDGFKEVNGYITKVGTINVGVEKKDSGWWYATELKTGLGCYLNGCKTRKEAVNEVEKNMDIIKRVMKTDKYKEAKKELKEFIMNA